MTLRSAALRCFALCGLWACSSGSGGDDSPHDDSGSTAPVDAEDALAAFVDAYAEQFDGASIAVEVVGTEDVLADSDVDAIVERVLDRWVILDLQTDGDDAGEPAGFVELDPAVLEAVGEQVVRPLIGEGAELARVRWTLGDETAINLVVVSADQQTLLAPLLYMMRQIGDERSTASLVFQDGQGATAARFDASLGCDGEACSDDITVSEATGCSGEFGTVVRCDAGNACELDVTYVGYCGDVDVVFDSVNSVFTWDESATTPASGHVYYHGTTTLTEPCGCSDLDGDGDPADLDCNDADADFFHGAEETDGVGIDYGCDGLVACFMDADGDGVGVATTVSLRVEEGGTQSCTRSSGDGVVDEAGAAASSTSANTDDCDDNDAAVFPGAAETVGEGLDKDCDGLFTCYVDDDDDTFGSEETIRLLVQGFSGDTTCERPSGFPFAFDEFGVLEEAGTAAVSGDCHDDNRQAYPGATEICASLFDEDCIDEPNDEACDNVTCETAQVTTTEFIFVSSTDGVTEDTLDACGTTDDDGDTSSGSVYYAYEATGGDVSVTLCTKACEEPLEDCDAWEAPSPFLRIYEGSCGSLTCATGATRITDPVELGLRVGGADCSDVGDSWDFNSVSGTTYTIVVRDAGRHNVFITEPDPDRDEDGYPESTDCNDEDPTINPGEFEVLGNTIDEDCDFDIDFGEGSFCCYADVDGDGYGDVASEFCDPLIPNLCGICFPNSNAGFVDCTPGHPLYTVSNVGGDCDDSDDGVHEGATEIPGNDVDEDCDGSAD